MPQPDPLEIALAEFERVRAAQDAELRAVFATFTDLGAAMVDVDNDDLRRLSECSECIDGAPNADLKPPLNAVGRC
jgi:hypothetical protein